MREKIQKIAAFLKQDFRSVITIRQNGRKLSKPTKTMKYAFSESDILNDYDSVEDFITNLPNKGFNDGTEVILRKHYETNSGFHNIEKIVLNFFDNNMEHQRPTSESPIVANPPQPNTVNTIAPSMGTPAVGMGYANVPQNEWLNTKVKEQRYNEIEFQLKTTQEELLDARSKLRVITEEKSNLERKLETAKERYELKLERELLNKKGFFETPSGEKVMEVVGLAMPQLLSMATKTPAVGMGAPNASELKQQFINVIYQEFVTDTILQDLYQHLETLIKDENNDGK